MTTATDERNAIRELGAARAVEIAASALAAHGAAADRCRNCHAPVIADYCAVCGQERDSHRRSLWALFHELLEEITSLDSRILRTAGALLLRPGELPRAFHEGRTRRYVPAVRLYLLVSLAFFVTLSLTGIDLVQLQLREVANAYRVYVLPDGHAVITSTGGTTSRSVPRDEVSGGKDLGLSPGVHSGLVPTVYFFQSPGRLHQNITPARWKQIEDLKAAVLKEVGNDPNGWMARNALSMIEKLGRDPAALNGPLTTWIPRVLFLLLPLFATLLALFYIRQRKTFLFVDHLVFSLTMHSFMFAVLIVAIGAAQILSGPIVADLVFAALAGYLLLSLKAFYRQGWAITAVKFGAIAFLYATLFLIPALSAVVAASLITG